MTEEEAKTKWCPFVRLIPATDQHRVATNRGEYAGDKPKYSDSGNTCCVASACAAWRWAKAFSDGSGFETSPNLGMAKFQAQNSSKKEVVGYCGLAGKP